MEEEPLPEKVEQKQYLKNEKETYRTMSTCYDAQGNHKQQKPTGETAVK